MVSPCFFKLETFTIEFYEAVSPNKVKFVQRTTKETPQNAYANIKILKKLSFLAKFVEKSSEPVHNIFLNNNNAFIT